MSRLSLSLGKVGGNTLLSRVLGFTRDLLVARLFGADAGTDAFFVAFKIPNLFRRFFGEGAIASALIPVLHEAQVVGGQNELRQLLDSLSGYLGAGLFLLTLIGILAAPWLVLIFAPGFAVHPGQHELAGELLRLTLPYVAFVVLAALAGAVLNLHERFGVPAFTPVMLNLAIIGCAIWLAPRLEEPILALGWGVLLGGLAQLGLQLPFLARLGLLPRPRLAWPHPGTRRVLGRLGPVLIGGSVTQINLLLDTFLASFLVSGSISWLYYADRLVEFPLGTLGAALGIVILPRLTRQGLGMKRREVEGESATALADFSNTLDWGLRWVLLCGLPATLGLVVLAEPLIATLFLSTEFGAHDVRMAGAGLAGYAVGLMAFMTIKVLAPAFFAQGDTRTPLRIGLATLALNLGLSLALMRPLGQAGLALATSLAAWGNAGLLYLVLLRSRAYRPGGGWGKCIGAALLAAAAMGTVLHLGSQPLSDWLGASAWERLLRLCLWVGAGAALYLVALLALGVRFGEQ
jgi:putative peptidoglycan lipid II flippase